MRWLMISLLALPLAACNDEVGNVQFSMNGMDADGNTASLSLDLPGIKGKLDIPKPDIDADDFKLNGVPLYPGSKIGHFDLNIAKDGGDGHQGVVEVQFESPAAPGKVRDYFRDRLSKEKFQLQDSGLGLSGKTDDGKPFSIDLAPAGADKTKGTIRVSG